MNSATNPESRPPPSADAAWSVRWILTSVRHGKWVLIGVAVSTLVATVAWTTRQTPMYEASCSLEYDPNPARPLDLPDETDAVLGFAMTREFYETQNRIISSRDVGERVVRRLMLHRDAAFMEVPEHERATWRGGSVQRATERLHLRLRIDLIKDTRLVTITVRDADPDKARLVANTVADAYVEKTVEDRLSSTVDALEWLRSQLETLRDNLETSEFALHDFKRSNNVLSLSMEDRQNILTSEIQSLNASLTSTRLRGIELNARLSQLRDAANADPASLATTTFAQDPGVLAQRDRLLQKQAERERLAVTYGPRHPNIVSIDAETTRLREQLRADLRGYVDRASADLRENRRIETGIREAVDRANAAGLELNLKEIEYSRLSRDRESNSKLYDLILERTAQADLSRMLRVSNARIVDRAVRPRTPVTPNVELNVALGSVGGVLLGLLCALALAQFDRRVKTVTDAENLGLTVIGVVPKIGGDASLATRYGRRKRATPGETFARDLVAHTHPMSSVAESLRTLRTNLTFMAAEAPLRALVVTSPGPQEGKTTLAINLAVTLAKSGKRTLLVDTDLRRPRVHRALGIRQPLGITSILVAESTLEEAVAVSDIPGLDVLPCGPTPPNPSELLHAATFHDLVEAALAQYDRIVFDSPPLGLVTDAAILAKQTSGAILVIKSNHTTRDRVRSAMRQLQDIGATLIGGVVNDIDPSRSGGQYGAYYYGGEGYYSAGPEDDEPPAAQDGPPPTPPPPLSTVDHH